MKKIAISIPTPCHENWQSMDPTEQGRFCSSCKKEVIDFSVLTDKEIVSYLKKAKGESCGSFLPQQLDRSISVPKERAFSWKYFFQILLPAFLIAQKPEAQTLAPSVLKTSVVNHPADDEVIVVGGMVSVTRLDNIINGKIIDSITESPIPFTTIKVKGSNAAISADSAGFFSLKTKNKRHPTLVITSVGYEAKEINVNSIYQFQTIKLVAEKKLMEAVTVTGYEFGRRGGALAYCTWSKATYLQRIKDTLLKKNYFNIYPNPVNRNSIVNINMKGVQQGEFLLQVADVQGKILQQEKIEVPDTNFNFQLNLKNEIVSGAYFIRIISPDKKLVHSGKIIIEQ
jgi:hypothetical protein